MKTPDYSKTLLHFFSFPQNKSVMWIGQDLCCTQYKLIKKISIKLRLVFLSVFFEFVICLCTQALSLTTIPIIFCGLMFSRQDYECYLLYNCCFLACNMELLIISIWRINPVWHKGTKKCPCGAVLLLCCNHYRTEAYSFLYVPALHCNESSSKASLLLK